VNSPSSRFFSKEFTRQKVSSDPSPGIGISYTGKRQEVLQQQPRIIFGGELQERHVPDFYG
jgi:hypothetical protein